MRNFTSFLVAMTLLMIATPMLADTWSLNPSMSHVAFGSIKNNDTGESHSFEDVSGTVSDAGIVTLSIGLGSVSTNIDIRNERMVEFVFQNAPTATITAQIDMADVDGLTVGAGKNIDTEGTLALLGTKVDLDASFYVIRLSDRQVLVATNGMIMLSTEDAGINAGIDALQELAGLDSITRVSPVSMRLVFDKDR